MMSTVFLLYHENVLPVRVEVNRLSRGLKLSCRLGGELLLTVPPGTPRHVIHRFLEENREVIGMRAFKAMEKAESLPSLEEAAFPWLGKSLPVLRKDAARNTARLAGEKIILCLRGGDWAFEPLDRLRKRLSEPYLTALAQNRAEELGFSPITVTVRPMLSRYGSCQPSSRHICLSSFLTRLPEEIILSVIDHELCHLNYHGHDRKFYQGLYRICPDYDRCHNVLRKELDPYLRAVRLRRKEHQPHPALNDFSGSIL